MKRYFNLYKIFLRFSFLNFTVFRANFINSMVSTVDWGELDFILLKPVDSQFMITNFMQGYPNLIRIGLGIILLVFYLHINNISISFVGLLGFLVFIVFGIMLLYSL